VTAADTLLGEGIAELLAAEFTGERGPLAVHMGTVIRAWRQAGGSAGVPLSQADAMRTARRMGAGYFVDGSMVGLGNRLTVTASVVSVENGRTRRSEPIRGSADSLDVLMNRLAATLLALAGAESREGSRGVMTSSPAAMREYLVGMAAWRRFRTPEASAAFERAFGEDTVFARAAFMRYWIASWFSQPVSAQWAQAAWRLRDRLSASDRALLLAQLGEAFPAQRSPRQNLADRLRVAALLPESPEAQYLAGDMLYHFGYSDVPDAVERSRGYFARSFELDSQTTVLSHLVAVSVELADTSLMRSLERVVSADTLGRTTVMAWYLAGVLGDAATLARLRESPLDSLVPGGWGMVGKLPAAVADELLVRLRRSDMRSLTMRLAVPAMQGRPGAVRALLALSPPATPDVAAFVTQLVLTGDLDSASGGAAVVRLQQMPGLGEAAASRRDCDVALWQAWWGTGPAWPDSVTARGDALNCPAMVNLLRAWRAGAPGLLARLESADSLVRWRLDTRRFQGYENFVLARVWESQGNYPRAASAVRLGINGLFGSPRPGHGSVEEGRLALLAADTATAIRAYRTYLRNHRDAEPELNVERDSVRATLVRLERR